RRRELPPPVRHGARGGISARERPDRRRAPRPGGGPPPAHVAGARVRGHGLGHVRLERDCGPREPGRRLRFDSRRRAGVRHRATRSALIGAPTAPWLPRRGVAVAGTAVALAPLKTWPGCART